ncbi:TetR/AcrR family transcriptional regulator [Demequina sp. NBRC 110054]|uniref:TetR/AcrR family transcriptional regulator n=1 Tax=Demequina sp. NBRC 110054 TaxID=1570343 RepID=UPI000A03D83F|nr:TetR family transcriptional regulator [Demequina sp. NBRC 110054]
MVDTTGSPGAAEPPARGHSRGSAREHILATATALIAARGMDAVTMADVAAACAIAPSALEHQYPSKEDLLTAVLARRDEVTERKHGTADAPGRRILTEIVRHAEDNAGVRNIVQAFAMIVARGTDDTHPAHDYFQVRYVAVHEQWVRTFLDLKEAGELRDGVDPAVAARQTTALMDGLQIQWLYDERVDMAADLRCFFDSLLLRPLEG